MADSSITINLTIPSESVVTGKQITFKAPCDSNSVTGVKINDSLYSIVDSFGNPISTYAFSEGSIVSIILDNEASTAIIQNPNTTKYIEDNILELISKLGTKANATHTHTADEVSETSTRKLMTADERTKLSGIATGATKTIVDQVLDKDSTNAVANKVVHKEISNIIQMHLASEVSTNIFFNHVAQQGHFSETDTGTSGKIWLGETLIQWGEVKKSNSEANKTEQVNITFDSGYGYKSKNGFIVFCTVYATDPETASVAPSGRTAGGFNLNYWCNTTKESTICWLTVGRGTKNATEEIFAS